MKKSLFTLLSLLVLASCAKPLTQSEILDEHAAVITPDTVALVPATGRPSIKTREQRLEMGGEVSRSKVNSVTVK